MIGPMDFRIDIPDGATPLDILRAVALSDPDPDRRWEVIGDMLVPKPSPKDRHGWVQNRIGRRIGDGYDDLEGDPADSWTFIATPDLKDVVGRDGLARPKIPDLARWRPGRYERNGAGYAVVTPDWVCEILSPSTAHLDKGPKADDYADLGIDWYWLVDLDGRTLEVRSLDGATYSTHATHPLAEAFCADPFQKARFAPEDFPD